MRKSKARSNPHSDARSEGSDPNIAYLCESFSRLLEQLTHARRCMVCRASACLSTSRRPSPLSMKILISPKPLHAIDHDSFGRFPRAHHGGRSFLDTAPPTSLPLPATAPASLRTSTNILHSSGPTPFTSVNIYIAFCGTDPFDGPGGWSAMLRNRAPASPPEVPEHPAPEFTRNNKPVQLTLF